MLNTIPETVDDAKFETEHPDGCWSAGFRCWPSINVPTGVKRRGAACNPTMNATGHKRPHDGATAANSAARKTYDAETEGDLKRLSRTLGTPIVAGGWLFEGGDKHPLPADSGGERE